MSGLLEQKIREVAFPPDKKLVYPAMLHHEEVEKIVAEAKKDFPDFDFAEITDSTDKFLNMPIAVLVDTNKIREVKEWFVRWFGE